MKKPNPILIHLANLKFFGNFRRSPAKNFDQYVKFTDLGKPNDFQWFKPEGKQVVEKFLYSDPLDDTKFEDDVEEEFKKRNNDKINLKEGSEEWFWRVTSHIEYLLEKEDTYLVLEADPFETLKSLLINQDEKLRENYHKLRSFIKVSAEDFFEYITLMQMKEPQEFFSVFSNPKVKKIRNLPLIHCFPRIFKTCKEYEFFTMLTEQLVNPQADLNFIFYQMKTDKFIYPHCKPEFQELINEKLGKDYIIYSEKKVTNSFNDIYLRTFKSFY